MDNLPNDEFNIDDGDNYELVTLDLPIDIYEKLVELAGSEDEYEMSKVVNRIIALEIKNAKNKQDNEDDTNE